ncbi:DUF4336 domain-containing protein [Rhodopseudomonas palustris]|uniref:DUF4336 domain-containing protein n=1 Tax=Rhodopseudomonas palustris (strain BisB18) TaxID=316056 RepID=Q217I2_RHOPB
MSRVTYPPLNVPKPVADSLWIVDSGPMRPMGLSIPVRMTIVRLANGDVWLHSPTPWSSELARAIQQIGPIRHLVAPNIAHWTFVKEWQDRFPAAVTWAAPGLRRRGAVKTSGLRIDHDLGAQPPADWSEDLDQRLLTGGFGLTEVVFLHKPSNTLIAVDLVQNFEAEKISPALRPLARLGGVVAPDGEAPPHYRFAVNRKRSEAQRIARELVDQFRPERVIFEHGQWFERDGTEQLRTSLRWLLT